MNLTKEDRIARHKRFLQANWQLLAAFSWKHFQKEGSGFVVAMEEDFVHVATPQYAPIRLRYIAENSAKFPEVMKMLGEKELNWVRTYDPDARVPILIIRDNGGTSGYLIGGNPKPSEAFAKEQAKKNLAPVPFPEGCILRDGDQICIGEETFSWVSPVTRSRHQGETILANPSNPEVMLTNRLPS